MARSRAYSCGSINGASSRSNYIKGCRCNKCTTAHRIYMAEYMQRRRQTGKKSTKNSKKRNKIVPAVVDNSIPVEQTQEPKSLKQIFAQSLNKKRG